MKLRERRSVKNRADLSTRQRTRLQSQSEQLRAPPRRWWSLMRRRKRNSFLACLFAPVDDKNPTRVRKNHVISRGHRHMNGGAPQSGRKAQKKTQLNSTHSCASLVVLRSAEAGGGTRCVRTVSTALVRWSPYSLNAFETSGHSFLWFLYKRRQRFILMPLYTAALNSFHSDWQHCADGSNH